jgi:hypothetical protein
MFDAATLFALATCGIGAFLGGSIYAWRNYGGRMHLSFGAGILSALVAGGFVFISRIVIFGYVPLFQSETATALTPQVGKSKPKVDLTTKSPPVAAPPKAKERAPATNTQEPLPANVLPQHQAERVAAPAENKPSSNHAGAEGISKEEMDRLEKDAGYTGDDPIVRRRLGLPPKPEKSVSVEN